MNSKRGNPMQDRYQYILSALAPGMRVCNLGCCGNDWEFEPRWRTSVSLHRLIHAYVGKENLIGADILKHRVHQMRDEWKYDVRICDVETDIPALASECGTFDMVVAGELIEHLARPGAFLSAAHLLLKDDASLILTTPNAEGIWSYYTYGVRGNKEKHPEHVCVYRPEHLTNLLIRCGYEVVNIQYLLMEPAFERKYRKLKEMPEKLIPRLAPAIGVTARSRYG
jgi:2-polyprenyl-3-methyl-5-hydroxy-6-metoxy-1,4-benzoquinol methylase